MRRILFLSGVALLLGGLTMLLISASMLNTKLVTVGKVHGWEISCNLEEGKTYVLDVISSDNWTKSYIDGQYYLNPELVTLGIVIISPDGGETEINASFYGEPSPSPFYRYRFRPKIVSVEYISVDSDSIEVDMSYSPIRFTVKQKGKYTVCIINETLYWAEGPPDYIKIQREVVEIQEMYPIFNQGGGALFIVGIAVSIFGAKAKAPRKSRIKRKKRYIRKK